MFDFEGARAQGFSDDEIVNEVKASGQYNYKFDEATKDGVPPAEIVNFLSKNPDRYIGEQQTMEASTSMVQPEPTQEDLTPVNIIPTQEDLDAERNLPQKQMIRDEEEKLKAQQQGLSGAPMPTVEQTGIVAPLLDPLLFIGENAVVTGVLKGAEKVIDKVRWPKWAKDIFSSQTPESYDQLKHTVNYMQNELGIPLNDAMLKGAAGGDLEHLLTKNNVFATNEAIQAQRKVINEYNDIMTKTLKSDINVDISSWRGVKQLEDNVVKNVEALRGSYKKIEDEYYNNVTKIASGIKEEYKVSDWSTELLKELTGPEGIPRESVDAVRRELTRFTKPYADETAELGKLGKQKAKILVDMKKNKKAQKEALKDGDDKKAIKLEQNSEKLKEKLNDVLEQTNSLKDVRYMTVTDLLNTRKLLTKKIYKPGGAISANDADEIRGLKLAVKKLDEFLDTNVKDPKLKEALVEARKITRNRAELFGAKDTGGDKALLADFLNAGDYGRVTEALTGKNSKENILHIRDVFGKNSEAYENSLRLYVTDKLGLTPSKIQSVLDQKKVAGVEGAVDIKAAATKISTLDAEDIAMIKNAFGDKAGKDIKAMQSIVTNMADLEEAMQVYGKGISSGKRAYVTGGTGITGVTGRGLKLIKDATTHYLAKRTNQIISNQPKFRTATGALMGETVYLGNTDSEDLTLSGAIVSAVTGGVGGYYMGKATRTLLESDAAKVARYLEMGRGAPKNMPKAVQESMQRLEKAAGASQPRFLKDELAPKQVEVPSMPGKPTSFADEYDSMPLPTGSDIGRVLDPEAELKDNFKSGGSMAGGGTPPKVLEAFDTPDIKQQIKKLENIIPEGSYIKPEEFHKYKPEISVTDKANLYARQGLGYMNDGPGLNKVGSELLVDSKLVRDGDMSVEAYNTKYSDIIKNNPSLRIDSKNKWNSQDENTPQSILDDLSEEYNQKLGDMSHDRASVVIDKPLYVTKTGDIHGGKVSAFAVSPKELYAFYSTSKADKVYKVPAGSKITFSDVFSKPHEGQKNLAEEVVIDSKLLKEADSKSILGARRGVEQLKKKYTKLILESEGMSKAKANFMVEKQKYRLDDYSKLFSILGISGAVSTQSEARDEDIIANIVKKESKGNYKAKNPESTAKGKYQIVDATRKEWAKKLGISEKDSLTQEGQEKIFNGLYKNYTRLLKKWDIPKSEANIYTIHQLGQGRAWRFFNNKLKPRDIKVMNDNLPSSMKVDNYKSNEHEVVDRWISKYRQ